MGIKITVEIPTERYSEIEEYCINKAVSIAEYFLFLHEQNVLYGVLKNLEKSERMTEFHRKFESLVQQEKQSYCDKELSKETLPIDISEKERKPRKKS